MLNKPATKNKLNFILLILLKYFSLILDENFGIFLNDIEFEKKSFWLLNSRTLKFYDIENNVSMKFFENVQLK